ncbi:MAG: acetate uptake transporter [Acidobacteriaceae bacterium]|jgi:succinate-acetate transporter protein
MSPNVSTLPTNIKVANPGPLGLFGFGLTTCLLSSINAGLIPPASIAAVVPLAFAYGGLAQFVAGIMEFRLGNTFGGVAFTSYSMFWWWFSLLLWTLGAGWLKAPAPQGMATALLLWGVFTFLLWIVTFRLNKILWSVFLLLTITFFLLAAKDFGFGDLYGKLGGYVGLATGIDAVLLAFFELLNAVAGYTVVPLGEPIVLNLALSGRVGVAVV